MFSTRLKKGDQIEIITGKDKGKKGRILRIDKLKNRVLVEGLNMVKKTQKPKKQNEKGGIIEIEVPLSTSNVMVFCKKCSLPVRTAIQIRDGNKVRVCRKCGEAI